MVIGTRFLEVEYPVDEKGHPSREDCDKVAWPNYHFRFQNSIICIICTSVTETPGRSLFLKEKKSYFTGHLRNVYY
jgi:hypothetical protein